MPRTVSHQGQPATTLWLPQIKQCYDSVELQLFSCRSDVLEHYLHGVIEPFLWNINNEEHPGDFLNPPRNIPCSLKISHLNYIIFDELQQPCRHGMSDMVMCQVGFIEFVITPLAEQMVTWPMAVDSSTKTPTLKPGKMRSFWVETILLRTHIITRFFHQWSSSILQARSGIFRFECFQCIPQLALFKQENLDQISMSDPMPTSNDRSAAAIVASCQVVTFPALSFLTQNLSRDATGPPTMIRGCHRSLEVGFL